MNQLANRSILVLLLSLASCSAPSVNNQEVAKYHELLVQSGHVSQLNQFAAQIKNSMRINNARGVVPETVMARMMDGVDKYINLARMQARISRVLAKKLNQDELDRLLSWYQSDVAQKVIDARFSTDATIIDNLKGNVALVAAAKRLDRLLSESEHTIKRQIKHGVAAVASWYMARDAVGGAPLEEVRQRVGRRIRQDHGMVKEGVLIGHLFVLDGLSADERAQYLAFCESKEGKKFNRIVRAETIDAMGVEIDEMLEKLNEAKFDRTKIGEIYNRDDVLVY